MGSFHFLSVGVFALGLLCAAGAAGQDDAKERAIKEEMKKLEGTWRLVATEVDGKEKEAGKAYDVFLIFANGKCSLRTVMGDKEKTREVEFTIGPTKSPRWLETEGPDLKSRPGIYELKDDTLRLSVQTQRDGKRPTELKTKEGGNEVLSTYKRVKPQ